MTDPTDVSAYGPEPSGWPEMLTPYTPFELLALLVVAVLVVAYVLGLAVMLGHAGVTAVTFWEERRGVARVAAAAAVLVLGILSAVVWPAGRLLEVVQVREGP